MVGTAVTMGIGIYGGQLVHQYVPESATRWLTGLFFVIFGALVLTGRLHG
jgi:putative Ca2+/H+ antiporter (TMEM165/GDT1 family)